MLLLSLLLPLLVPATSTPGPDFHASLSASVTAQNFSDPTLDYTVKFYGNHYAPTFSLRNYYNESEGMREKRRITVYGDECADYTFKGIIYEGSCNMVESNAEWCMTSSASWGYCRPPTSLTQSGVAVNCVDAGPTRIHRHIIKSFETKTTLTDVRNGDVLVEVNDVPLSHHDIMDVIFSPETTGMYTNPKPGQYIPGPPQLFPVVTGGDTCGSTVSGFLKIEYVTATNATLRPTADRLELALSVEKALRDAREAELQVVKAEMERREKAEEARIEAMVRERVAKEMREEQEKVRVAEETARREEEVKERARARVAAKAAAAIPAAPPPPALSASSPSRASPAAPATLPPPPPPAAPLSNTYTPLSPSSAQNEAFAAHRSSNTAYEFVVKWNRKEPMGLTFKTTGTFEKGLEVEDVAPGSQTHAFGIAVGDLVVGVCGEDVRGMNANKVAKKVGKCKDRSVGFVMGVIAKEKAVAVVESGVVMHVTGPGALYGSYAMERSSWGGAVECGGKVGGLGVDVADGKVCGDGGGAGEIMFAGRGVCSFVDKGKAASARGVAALVIVNTDKAAMPQMPTGNVNTDAVTVPVVSVGDWGNVFVNVLVKTTHKIEGYFDCVGGTNSVAMATVGSVSAGDGGGHMAVVGTGTTLLTPVAFRWSRFKEPVPEFGDLPVKISPAFPVYGCDADKYENPVRGAYAVVMRGGGCGFGEKVLAAQENGAIGVVVVDEMERAVQRIMATEEEMEKTVVPVGMVSGEAWEGWFGKGAKPTQGDYYAKIVIY